MKKFLLLSFAFLVTMGGVAQVLAPATWSYKFLQTEAMVGDEIEIEFTVLLDKTWHLYTVDLDPDVGPLPTEFTFEPDASYELVGEMVQLGTHENYDSIWGGVVSYFSDEAIFKQKIKILANDLKITGIYEYLTCTTVDGMCIPGDGEFDFVGLKVNGGEPSRRIESSLIDEPEHVSLWAFAIGAFLAGLLALLTPCVFPMIPMTVTFFMKDGEESGGIRKAIIFGLSIMLIFVILGTAVAMIFGADSLNNLATHWIPNTFVFLIFFVFALSFLGLFEITLPSSFVNKMDQQADKEGLTGVFFMAFTLALVSFSCTFPIVGSVLVLAAGGEFMKPILGMGAFSLAFALPFTLFAIFPSWLKGLPKSGGWLNTVKVSLGLLELALGLKFLSIADQAYHWGILDREIYLGLWIVIFAVLGFYLLGKIRLPHDSKMESVGVLRLIISILVFTFVLYLIPGMWGAPLKGLAGYLPPMSTHDYNLPELIAQNNGSDNNFIGETQCETPLYGDLLHFPHGIRGFFELDQAIDCAKKQGKPLFIDFTGHGCVNCREMEARVWSDPEVLRRLKNDYVVLALYVDDRTKLPESSWYTSDYDNKVKKTIGKQNADFQITAFNNNAQPYYVLMDSERNVLVKPIAYDLSISGFIEFLEKGKQEFANRYQSELLIP